jgi:hypothetical protein
MRNLGLNTLGADVVVIPFDWIDSVVAAAEHMGPRTDMRRAMRRGLHCRCDRGDATLKACGLLANLAHRMLCMLIAPGRAASRRIAVRIPSQRCHISILLERCTPSDAQRAVERFIHMYHRRSLLEYLWSWALAS